MQLDYLKYVFDVAETGSITKSSERLMISQPAISKAIKILEKEYNTIIFNRKNNGMELTKEGMIFIAHVKHVLFEIDYLNNIYLKESEGKKFKLDVITDTNINISPAIENIYNLYRDNNIIFNVKETHREEVIEKLNNNEYDIGLFAMSNLEQDIWLGIFDERDLVYKEIKRTKAYVVVSSNSSLYYKDIIVPDELPNETVIYYIGKEGAIFNIFVPIEITKSLKSNKEIYLNDKKTIEYVITNTDAYLILLDPSQVKDTSLKAIPFEVDNIYFSLGWLKRKKHSITKESQEFIKQIYKSYEN